MAENGLFRVCFRGFNKDDVLKYIEQMKTDSARRYADLERKYADLEGKYADLECRYAEMQAAFDDAKEETATANAATEQAQASEAEWKEKAEKLTALAKIYKSELLTLRQQIAEHEDADVKAAAQEMNAKKIAELEEQCQLLSEQNARYASIVGDVNRLVVEARVVSGSYFDAAHQKTNECLRMLDVFLDELKAQTREAAQVADDRRREGDAHIQTLLTDLQERGDLQKH